VVDEHAHRSVATLSALASCCGAVCPRGHELRREIERRLRARQREDGSFGSIVDTSRALVALLELGPACVQTTRAARFLVGALERAPEDAGTVVDGGFGLSPSVYDPTAGAREAALALEHFQARGGKLADGATQRTESGSRPDAGRGPNGKVSEARS
jgi:hypothetical protein